MRSKLTCSGVYDQCAWALSKGLEHSRPEVVIDSGYVCSITDNLVPDILAGDFERDLASGAGSELDEKFLAAHSSCALAVNCFAIFRRIGTIELGKHRDLRLLGFEQKFPVGLARATPPHLDVVATAPSQLVAIESKCIEYLLTRRSEFSKRYAEIDDERRDGPWFGEMARLTEGGQGYRLLNVSQLIKHAFGLAKQRLTENVALVYLYWEPLDADLSPLFGQHRDEISAFAERVSGGSPSFEAMTYHELWAAWDSLGNTVLSNHVRNLRSRYEVPAWSWEGVSWVDGRITNAGLIND